MVVLIQISAFKCVIPTKIIICVGNPILLRPYGLFVSSFWTQYFSLCNASRHLKKIPYLCSVWYWGVAVMYWAPKSAVQLAFEGLLLVDIRPPQPLALSQTEILPGFVAPSASRADVTPLVNPPPITGKKFDRGFTNKGQNELNLTELSQINWTS